MERQTQTQAQTLLAQIFTTKTFFAQTFWAQTLKAKKIVAQMIGKINKEIIKIRHFNLCFYVFKAVDKD